MFITAKLILGLVACAHCHYGTDKHLRGVGPLVTATQGEPWPKPQLRTMYNDTFMVVRPTVFRFKIVKHSCDMLEDALKRYYGIILKTASFSPQLPVVNVLSSIAKPAKAWKSRNAFAGYLDVLEIHLMAACEYTPHDSMDEAYELKINSAGYEGKGLLTASSNWGILRGLETFSQLLYNADDLVALQIKSTMILDYPRFSYRSVLLDSSRHFLSMKSIKQNLDLMAINKYNVFHWHIVDDQSFPYQSKTYPELSNKGAYHPYTHIYTQQDIAEVLEYARVRGIRVIPEFDTPGHTLSWGLGAPELLTPCYDHEGRLDGTFGPVDPTKEATFDFMKNFFQEITEVFPDKYVHLGGDEVSYDCWKSSPVIKSFMEAKNFSNYTEVEEYYVKRLMDIVEEYPKNATPIVWQEVLDNGANISKKTLVHVWKNYANTPEELHFVTSLGYTTLFSSCWYLNKISYGIDWHQYYNCDPHNFNGTDAQKRLVIGGGATMWTEYVDSTNLISRLWPRAAVPAERLWSAHGVRDLTDAAKRLEEHRCRLMKRGFQVEPPNGPGFCSVEWNS